MIMTVAKIAAAANPTMVFLCVVMGGFLSFCSLPGDARCRRARVVSNRHEYGAQTRRAIVRNGEVGLKHSGDVVLPAPKKAHLRIPARDGHLDGENRVRGCRHDLSIRDR